MIVDVVNIYPILISSRYIFSYNKMDIYITSYIKGFDIMSKYVNGKNLHADFSFLYKKFLYIEFRIFRLTSYFYTKIQKRN